MSEKEAEKRVSEILTRGVGTFVDPDGAFKKKLIAKATGKYHKDIIIKFGVDPTRPDIHLGHAVVLRKLRQLQNLGCKVVFLIGDITALIGDPTGKSTIRPEIEYQEILKNLLTYTAQIDKILIVQRDNGKIIHNEKFSWVKNSEWFIGVTDITANPNNFTNKASDYQKSRMQVTELGKDSIVGYTLLNVIALLRGITYAQLIERDMFQERIRSGNPLYMHEMFYPVLQGIDSVMINNIYGSCDCEVGGTDQTFNMLMGRKTMELAKRPEQQAVLSFELLVGLDGKEKMSKSLDNYIGITDVPNDMFGKIMSLPDALIPQYFELCVYYKPMSEVEDIKKQLEKGKINPRDIKMDLAEQIVAIYHGESLAKSAREGFVATFQNKKLPNEMPEAKVVKGALLVDVLIDEDVVDSKSEFRRLLAEGAIRKDGEEKLTDPMMKIIEDIVLKVGKHRFIKIVVQ